jgi:Na+/proline symporter
MSLILWDWIIIITYLIISIVIGLIFTRKATGSITDFFISGRQLPWWIAGTSMVATTFAADTPMAFSGTLTVFLFSKLWRRAEVVTDVELTEIRYSGRPASTLRGFKAVYLSIPINCIIIGWVNLAMMKVIKYTTGISEWKALLICFTITVLYCTLAGLWGIVINDFFQFWIAMTGSIILMFTALKHVGGISGLETRLIENYGPEGSKLLNFFPEIGSVWMPVSAVIVYLSINWWASWYPGAEPGGGGYVAQRMFSTKNEKHSLLATLWFNIAHYALRPWPWIIVALAAMVLYPNLADKEQGYIRAINNLLPGGIRGLFLAGFMAAYMSTISTHLNWGSSYLVNDFYRRFLVSGYPDDGYRFGCMEVLDCAWSRYGGRIYFEVVLVAYKRMVGNFGYDFCICGFFDTSKVNRMETFRTRTICRDNGCHGILYHFSMGSCYSADFTRRKEQAKGILCQG